MTDPSNAQNLQAQNTLAQNENPMSSTLTTPTPQDFDTQLSAEDQALLLQLTSGLEQRSAAAPTFASEAVLRKITGSSPAVDKNRRRKLAGFTVAVATLAGTPFVVRPAITAFRGEEKPVVVSTSTSAMPKFIVGGLDEKEILRAFVFPPHTAGLGGFKQVRLRKGTSSIEVSTFDIDRAAKGPNGESVQLTPVQIGMVSGEKAVIPWEIVDARPATYYYWTSTVGQLSAKAKGVGEAELLKLLGTVTRSGFSSEKETTITVGDKQGFIVVGESADTSWSYSVSYGPIRKYSLFVRPTDSLAEDSFGQATKFRSPAGREYSVDGPNGSRSFLTWMDPSGAQLSFGVDYSDEKEFAKSKPLTDEQFNEMVKLADSVRQVDDETFAKVVTSHSFLNNNSFSKVPRKAPVANVLDGMVDGVAWKLSSGETPLEKECQKLTFSGPEKPFTDCLPENPKDDFISLGAASVGAANPKTVVFGVVKDTLEIVRVRNSEGTVVGEDFSIENGYLDGRAFAIELPTNVTGELTVEAYSYDDDAADNLPEGQFLPDDAKPLATKTLNVK
jgi:hypothetical protein